MCVALLKIEQVEICQDEVNLSRVMLQREGKVWVTTISLTSDFLEHLSRSCK